ncbi:uncharacterized protein [Nicotiana tomentosiformis]|uniref:uncharacterized protein isoform X2 n=1 Tax=Nicotiana tomentosiformis TaxID=4098 RepID=UPI00388CBCE4
MSLSLSSTALSNEDKESHQENVLLVRNNLSNNGSPLEQEADEQKNENHDGGCNRDGNEIEYDEDEEEDVDFNPLLKEAVSPDASSSLSSEIEGLDADIVDSVENIAESLKAYCKERMPGLLQDCLIGDKELGEETVMQNRASSGACPEDVKKISSSELKKRESVLDTEPESGISNNKRTVFSGGGEGIEDLSVGECNNVANSRRSIIDMDNEDAICKRTRARYSLASQYRKFLAAVLLGGDGNSGNVQENENVDDEDEDNDADFELEIEEALESDIDEHVKDDVEEEYEAVSRRPKTRQIRRQRASVENKKKVLGLSNRPLRPLLPYLPISPYSGHGAKSMMLPRCSLASPNLSATNDGCMNGFTAHQIGQLHCLIHEHVQLLIQVFAVCVLEPARQHIASDVRELISQMLHKRDEVLASRSVPYPSFCFFSPYVHPSVSDEPLKTSPSQITNKMSSAHVLQGDCSSELNMVQPFDGISPSRGRHDAISQVGCPVGSWVPYISGPILSVLDVAPIKLVKDFMDDVSHAMQDYQHRQLGGMDDICSEKEPLFPVQSIHFTAEPDGQASLYSNIVPPPSSSFRTSKKTMAAVLVEKAKKQAATPVPKEIAKLAQRFYPLFNPALYPHKPPPAAVANRVLFTDAEDELLALGLMEYNTDWRAIQQRYLPCKSKHQIFVRQKNRSSSKAPENPIKAVRRMKNSPLTAEEVARIEEGLKVFKLDWMSVWKFIVPYRDPSLLPRQWRTAIGTQKSYKSDASKKAKRRLYEERRKSKAAALETWHISSEKEDNVADYAVAENSGADNCTERDEEAYVHEAFLADWRPAVSSIQVNHSMSDLAKKIPPAQLLGDESSLVAEEMNSSRSRNGQSHISNEFPVSLRASETKSFSQPYRARKFNNGQLVKLAPGLPPVNLPPSVRVISQSAFKSYHGGTYPRAFGGDACTGDNVRDNTVPKIASAAKNYFVKDGPFSSSAGKNTISNQNLKETSLPKDNKNVTEGKDESGLQMHPLLFRAPEDGPLPYYQSNSSLSTSSSFNFFSGCQPQLNLSLFHHPRQLAHTVNFLDKSSKLRDKTSISSGFDFHPLLQRTDDANCDLEAASSAARTSCISESSRGRCTQVQNAVDSSSNVACSIPSSPVGKSNEVDLEMHLSFTSRKQKAMGSRGDTDHYMGRSPTSASDSGDQNHHINRTPNRTTQHHDSGATAMILSSDEENGNDVDYMPDQSLAEIVMEQEELSDSEEEIEEDVEFECEEMEDSEGEEIFESEEIINDKNEVVDFHQTMEVNGIRFWCYTAGHVFGATMFMVDIAGVRVLYTGDYSGEEDRHLRAAETPEFSPDICIIESTYGVQLHMPRQIREKLFTDVIHSTLMQGGRVLIPAFALGCAQELLLILEEYWSSHPELANFPIYYASPLARRCMAVYQTYINAMNGRIRNQFVSSNPFNFKHFSSLNSIEDFIDNKPCVMASPGSLQSGLSRQLFDKWCSDKRTACVIPA